MRHQPLSQSSAFQALAGHHAEIKDVQLRELFVSRPARFVEMSCEAAGLFLDYSKNRAASATIDLLLALCRERGVEARRDAMFAGEKINFTEQRAVLHTALRTPAGNSLTIDGHDVSAGVHAVLENMKRFCERVRAGDWPGYTGKAITDIVNIGIGGSFLGPKMACQALRAFSHPGLTMHFVSNVDGHDLAATLQKANPETTLFIIASKTFTTAETMLNAQSARSWFLKHGKASDLHRHFVAVSTNTDAVKAFGIDPQNMFPFWDWVGGRYSIWSAIGLAVMLSIGAEQFKNFLAGAHAMDRHFQTAPLNQNMPVILASLGVWYRNFFNSASISIAPYHQDLNYFPGYLQQLEMESNGKRVDADGKLLDLASAPVVWGDVGTNGQHAYFQLLHQGPDLVPVDFIAALRPSHDLPEHHASLLANCFAQSEAFMLGKNADEVRAELESQKLTADAIDQMLPHKIFPGNRPSNTILMDELTPETLGALIALYEHKVLVQGVIWGVNSFDQWGVELGKVLAKNIEKELVGNTSVSTHDSSTNGLIARARAASQK